MTIPVDPSGGSDDLFLASIHEMNGTGATLTSDTNSLSTNMDSFWHSFESGSANLPMCVQNILSQFETTQKTLYAAHIQKRLGLAQALGQSTTLVEAVDKCCAQAFTDPTLANVSLTNLLPGK